MGGKKSIAPWVIGLFATHQSYIEPFGGGAAVLINKPKSKLEIYNDINSQVTTFFRVLRDDAEQLIRNIASTPFAREEFDAANELLVAQARGDIISDFELARATLISSRMRCHPSNPDTFAYGVPAHNNAKTWSRMPELLRKVSDRFAEVVIENLDWQKLIARHDKPDTLIYLDPPYLPSTRVKGKYPHELTEEDHERLIDALNNLQHAKYALSGYPSELYDTKLNYKHRATKMARTKTNSVREEVLYLNYEPTEN